MGEIKTIGVLTSGGDAPGMNAAVRAVTRTALANGINVMGIYEGYNGLLRKNIDKNIKKLERRDVSLILGRGGTFLRSSRCEEFKQAEYIRDGANICREKGIDALVALGGDGTFRGAKDLAEITDEFGNNIGIPCIGIPCTIDNDIGCTDYCIGFDTAVNTVTENIDRLRDTTASHYRCSVVEVMGRHCGDIALQAAINCGAVAVLLPEHTIDIEKHIIDRMNLTLHSGKSHFIVIVAEGVTDETSNAKYKLSMDAKFVKYIMDKNKTVIHKLDTDSFGLARYIEDKIEEKTNKEFKVETRATVLGHIQRGGSPSALDRIVAAEMGHHAVTLLMNGVANRVIVRRNSKITDLDIGTALDKKKTIDKKLIKVARDISIWDTVNK